MMEKLSNVHHVAAQTACQHQCCGSLSSARSPAELKDDVPARLKRARLGTFRIRARNTQALRQWLIAQPQTRT
jgi:hypothetical protein